MIKAKVKASMLSVRLPWARRNSELKFARKHWRLNGMSNVICKFIMFFFVEGGEIKPD